MSTDTDVSTGTAGDGRGKVTLDDVHALCERYRNWGKWGPDDQIGTLNYIEPEMVVAASALVRQGKVISCALPYDGDGPQNGWGGRVNPIHLMLQDGGDAAIGAQDHMARLRYADDAVYMPLQSGTQWDALSHVFYEGKMYNGFGQEHVSSTGAGKCGIELTTEKVVGRGVLLDIPRHRGVPWLEPGQGIDSAELAACAEAQGVTVGRGDFVLVRTGHIAMCRARGSWGDYAAGDAPGLSLDSAHWICGNEIAGVATDTWGMEVRPNETDEIFQPVHIVLLVNAGLLIGEIFDLEKLADDCAADGVYEFMFAAGPLPFTKAVGSPLNPLAIK
ncbi:MULTISPECIES: cyclase family protein [Nonomuraea]|uniref:Cyclase family protein n=1 Tax=Nonomuraea ferruginea TaxID=46174 RepID=A0ABT4T9Z0_9ACTN|nr:cyclase family protein [Nonomuraea ferruginea]MDA0646329.1 cyclase family protein [Nonomuraea ferruginea]